MADENRSRLADPDLWIRLVYMILFALLSWVGRVVILIIAAIQFVLALVTGAGNDKLRDLGWAIARWTEQNYRFLSFASDDKPYPFQDWPVPDWPEPDAEIPDADTGSISANDVVEDGEGDRDKWG